mmetsp:Transcript_103805/g.163927  ORF Transcript_103805/g.163927 Transcript_103805/m.163927 type:complete len:698 (+) Transcript_103805:103-2196(+)
MSLAHLPSCRCCITVFVISSALVRDAGATALLRQVPLLHRRKVSPRGELLQRDIGNAKFGTYGFDVAGQDKSVKPGDDFYKFANGKFLENLTIPADQSRWGNFDILALDALEKAHRILQEDQKSGGKMGNFYASFMNESLVEALDASPLKSRLDQIAAISSIADFATLSGQNVYGFLPSPFSVGIGPDPHNVDSYCVYVDQAGLGLPRDYYLKESFKSVKAGYAEHATKLLQMVAWPDAEKASQDILTLEDRIANASWSDAEMRDPVKTYNPMASVAALSSQAPGFDWVKFLQEAGGLPRSSKLVVGALGGVIGIAKIVSETDIEVLRSWAAFHFVNQVAPLLSARFVNASFKFSQLMTGQQVLSARWKRAVRASNQYMGDEVGKAYVDAHFPESSKKKVEGLTIELKKAFETRLKQVEWMTNETKQKALAKLASFTIQVGYPLKFKNYSALVVNASDLYGNVQRSIALEWNNDLAKLGKPVDRNEWAMTPQTVNAYNMPDFNQVVFPAAILQPPFFDPEADMAVNYGGIGAVIGHEMTHGFDDEGRKYNARGQLEDWWTPADDEEFKKRASQYGQQFQEFDLGIDAHIKPDLTMGEDIADLGGLTMALEAYANSQAAVDGIDQAEGVRRVFLGYAQVWRQKQRQEALLNQLVSDPHPPSRARVDIPCRNLDKWYSAFSVEEGQKLYLPSEKRVSVW